MKKTNWKDAFKEILFIVIGILIAFGINNWWQNRSDRVLEKEYLEALLFDINQNIENLEYTKNKSKERIYKPLENTMEDFVNGELKDNDTSQFLNNIQMAGYFDYFRIRRATYEDLKSSGRFNIINNLALKNELHEYFEKVKYYDFYYEGFYEYKTQNQKFIKSYPFRYHNYDLNNIEKYKPKNKIVDITKLLQDTELENHILLSMVIERWKDRSYDSMIDHAIKIRELLEEEVN